MTNKIKILGRGYVFKFLPEDIEDDVLKDFDGYCDETIGKIVVKKYTRSSPCEKQDLVKQELKNARHEIIHAFLVESGFAENSCWATNEEMVDWFARQWPKINKAISVANDIILGSYKSADKIAKEGES